MKNAFVRGLYNAAFRKRPTPMGDVTAIMKRLVRRSSAGLDATADDLETAAQAPWTLGRFTSRDREPQLAVPDGARFLSGTYANQAGKRAYKLFVPSGYSGQKGLPLIVMLHGCTQSPDDFAAGTRMNTHGEQHRCLILYPAQATAANHSKCWNWFLTADQKRDQGEPSIIAGMTLRVAHDYAVDARRIYIAGLSAGGAAAAVMAVNYPELYAGVGVHSGLPCGAARDLPTALAAMRQGGKPAHSTSNNAAAGARISAIVFHGDRDSTVVPANGDAVIDQFASPKERHTTVTSGSVPGGHSFTQKVYRDAEGRSCHEHWVIAGGEHAWSGGSTAGSYIDPRGPDASREMLRFFLEHPRREE
jgi:poly(hydroxyalkanoate) depolymerase family esterase